MCSRMGNRGCCEHSANDNASKIDENRQADDHSTVSTHTTQSPRLSASDQPESENLEQAQPKALDQPAHGSSATTVLGPCVYVQANESSRGVYEFPCVHQEQLIATVRITPCTYEVIKEESRPEKDSLVAQCCHFCVLLVPYSLYFIMGGLVISEADDLKDVQLCRAEEFW